MNTRHLLLALLAAILSLPACAVTCPGNATWCDDFEHGTERWPSKDLAASGATVQSQNGSGNHVLVLNGQGVPLLASEPVAQVKDAYFVEARMRPVSNAVTSSTGGQAYLIARYQDDNNWLGASLSINVDRQRLAVDLVKMQHGKLLKLKQSGKDAGPNGSFYTVRLDVAGGALVLYLNGEMLVSATDSSPFEGRIGLLAKGQSVEFDDVRIGAAASKPVRLALARVMDRVSLQLGDAPQSYQVLAFSGKDRLTLPLSALSSNASIAGVVVEDGKLVFTAKRPGLTTIAVSSQADANVATYITVRVDPAFTSSSQQYALQGKVRPASHADEVPVDTHLQIEFDQAPTLGQGGSVRIYRASDNALVDIIRVGEDIDEIGYEGQELKRVVRFRPIRIDGRTVTIQPHSARLAYGMAYYIAVDVGVFVNASLAGQAFTGLGQAAGWSFSTRKLAPSGTSLTVDDDGPADFRTVQGALNHAMRYLSRAEPVSIRIANGRYEQLLYLRGKDNITLRGESRDGVILQAYNDDGNNPGTGVSQGLLTPSVTGGRSVFLIEDADMLMLDTLTLVNTAVRAKSVGAQAETLVFSSDRGRLVAQHVNFFSEQDTIQVKGYSWFYRSLIAGNVDFIWGANRAALFEESEIRSVGDSANPGKGGGYVVQARTVAASEPGFVFLNSRLTHGNGPGQNDVLPGTAYLARQGPSTTWDSVSFIHCMMDKHIAPAGWLTPRPESAQAQPGAGWGEYGSMDINGKPLDVSQRLPGHTLTEQQVATRFASRRLVFADFDNGKGWNPSPSDSK
ncbi:Ig-like domain-containing protein [Undibacterium sp. CY18W]|uniref:Ig-like domain-containing protein n=1 Tax=Undibacterium hunanense TaxID=2762292 RepID=A0ABR6ZRF4_9BURK|nr:pectinesterase family protein [Undibacterium hunanense]MBC3918456.1 Ig-like domain-containing protein [Undibacterium hunanense]